ncbi:MAG: 6-carboxytetrahydropterin synthase [Algoriphagus sp.]|nr:6-carboxytetrahydropterin synthase [Algoriphagus sp.]
MLSITKIFSFEAAHRISKYQGACSQVHGHSYKLQITVSAGMPGDNDMILDFKVLKDLVQNHVLSLWDHSLILKGNAENRQFFLNYPGKIYWMDSEPTAERMLIDISRKLEPVLPDYVNLEEIVLFETETSYAKWRK